MFRSNAAQRPGDPKLRKLPTPDPERLIGAQAAALKEEAGGAPVSPFGPTSVFSGPQRELLGLETYGKLPVGAAARVFVRDAEAEIAPEYLALHLANLQASHEEVFLPALRDGTLFEDFLGTLRRQQAVLMDGPGGVYTGMTGKTVAMASESVRDPDQFQHPKKYRPHAGELLSEVRMRFGAAEPEKPAFSVTAEILRRLEVSFAREGKVALPGIPKKAQPSLSLAYPAQYIGPKVGDLPLYLDQMKLQLQLAFTSLDRPVALQHLADYLQLSSNTHLFPRGNNSMFMSHINFALERMGLNPISHGVLDVWAYVLDSKDFRPLFYEAVERANPGIQRPLIA
ncbi:MAG: hypothetical protein IPG45_37360 [Deltaproteobacteria bacterium]|nr:hypothetical protein [Deltaproteobacteria bacterium]